MVYSYPVCQKAHVYIWQLYRPSYMHSNAPDFTLYGTFVIVLKF